MLPASIVRASMRAHDQFPIPFGFTYVVAFANVGETHRGGKTVVAMVRGRNYSSLHKHLHLKYVHVCMWNSDAVEVEFHLWILLIGWT